MTEQIKDEQTCKDRLLQEGDHILEINGQIIKDAEHAMGIFADPLTRQYVVLLSRPTDEADDGDSVEELRMSFLEEHCPPAFESDEVRFMV